MLFGGVCTRRVALRAVVYVLLGKGQALSLSLALPLGLTIKPCHVALVATTAPPFSPEHSPDFRSNFWSGTQFETIQTQTAGSEIGLLMILWRLKTARICCIHIQSTNCKVMANNIELKGSPHSECKFRQNIAGKKGPLSIISNLMMMYSVQSLHRSLFQTKKPSEPVTKSMWGHLFSNLC